MPITHYGGCKKHRIFFTPKFLPILNILYKQPHTSVHNTYNGAAYDGFQGFFGIPFLFDLTRDFIKDR